MAFSRPFGQTALLVVSTRRFAAGVIAKVSRTAFGAGPRQLANFGFFAA
jgi:hypothetical protein